LTKTVTFAPNCLTVLPINWLRFTAENQANAVKLAWEVNPFGFFTEFELQKSQNGVAFETLHQLQFIDKQSVYQFMDKNAFGENEQKIHYRLQMQDLQGKIHFSEIKTVAWQNQEVLKVYPQPIDNQQVLKIELPKFWQSTGELTLLNALGKSVWRSSFAQKGVLEIRLPSLAQGIYLLKINTATKVYFHKLIVSNP
jgi:hypothetical protein